MDTFEIAATPGGHVVSMSKHLPEPRREVRPEDVRAVVDELMSRPPESLLEELHMQHQELLAVLDDLNHQKESLRAANYELEETNRGVMALYSEVTRELDDTNRGVLALYAQLDDQTESLRRVSSLKDRFLSHLSHEFRTPLNSTLALSRLLANRIDGPLTTEQSVQVDFIRTSAEDLLAMVDDLLDIAKIEAGRMIVRPEVFTVEDLVGSLRGMFRPLAAEAGLGLAVDDPDPGTPAMRTDRSKLGQILRNLLANAIQNTKHGTVSLEMAEVDGHATFSVRDTGVGIEPADLDRIFQDFVQAGAPRSRTHRGTGLGLPLSRQLAQLLGGEISAESEPGRGSVFRVHVPMDVATAMDEPTPQATTGDDAEKVGASGGEEIIPRSPGSTPPATAPRPPLDQDSRTADDDGPVVMVIGADSASRYLVEHVLAPTGCKVVPAATGAEGLAGALARPPAAVFLDLGLPDGSGFEILQRFSEAIELAGCPIIIYTSRELTHEHSRSLSGFTLRGVLKSDTGLLDSLTSIGDALSVTTQTDKEEAP